MHILQKLVSKSFSQGAFARYIGSIILMKGLHFLSCHCQCERNVSQLLCYVHLNRKPWSTAFAASTPVLYLYTPRTPTGQGAIQMPLVIVIYLCGASSFTEIFISDYVCLIGEEWPGEDHMYRAVLIISDYFRGSYCKCPNLLVHADFHVLLTSHQHIV